MKKCHFKSVLLLCALPLVGSALTGCDDSSSATPEPNPCDICTANQTCIENVCYENSKLCGDEHLLCGTNEECVNGACKPKQETDPDVCDGENATPCKDGYKCDEKTHHCIQRDPCDDITCPEGKSCLPATSQCIDVECIENGSEKSCPEGQMCSKGACIDDGCLDVQCKDGWQCIKGNCEETACIGKICNEGRTCVAGDCIDTECLTVQCEGELVCSKGECMYDACIGKEACKQGKICGKDGECQFDTAPMLVIGDLKDSATDENGKSISIPVTLNHEPAGDVQLKCDIKTESPHQEAQAACDDIIFNDQNWMIEQTIIVTGLADHVIDADQPYTLVLTTSSSDLEFDSLTLESKELKNLNVDKAGYVITPNKTLFTGEDGTKATFTIALAAQPTANVTITLASSNISAGTVSTDPIIFTPDNWDTPVEVTVTGVNDNVATGNKAYQIILAVATDDPYFKDAVADPINIINIDDDKPGITVMPVDITTKEGEDASELTIKLTTQPLYDVDLSLSIDDDTEVSIDATSLKFTTQNWNVPQTIKVSGLLDQIVDGDQPFTITIKSSSDDSNYKDLVVPIKGTNMDTDRAGFITSTSVSPIVTEAGSSVEVKVALASKPASDVNVAVSTSDDTEISVSKDALTFDATNWNVPQTLVVTGVDDHLVDGDIKSDLILTATSEDKTFDATSEKADEQGNKLNIAKVTFTTVDDDKADLIIDSKAAAMKENSGEKVEMSVVLSAQPESTVTVTVNSSDASSLGITSGSSLSFTAENWNVPQIVSATVVDDVYAETNKDVVISFVTSSDDKNFDGLKGNSETYTIIDDETITITMTATPSTLSRALGTNKTTISTVLSGAPSSDVTITLTAKTPTSTSLDKTTLTFTPTTWNIPQTFVATTNFMMPSAYDVETITGTAKGSVYDGKTAKVDVTIITIPEVQNFEYTGTEQQVTLYPGRYKLEVWGAQGGESGSASTYTGGKGGYASGVITVTETTNAYIYIAGRGSDTIFWGQSGSSCKNSAGTPVFLAGGFNGGGACYNNAVLDGCPTGGGATHIATKSGLLSTLSTAQDKVLIVAGGGGAGTVHASGGAAGGSSGLEGTAQNNCNSSYGCSAYGGTQIEGGQGGLSSTRTSETTGTYATAGSFGQGGQGYFRNYISCMNFGAGGGGGWYGGGGTMGIAGGGGGSSHTHASLTSTQTIAGNVSMPAPAGSTETGHAGNGYARITLLTD